MQPRDGADVFPEEETVFDHLKGFQRVIVTGPHRSGTTIAAEMISRDTGLPCIREEAFDRRNIIEAARLNGVIQGPYLLPWLPIFSGDDTAIVYMKRDGAAIDDSVARLTVSKPFFHWSQGWELWQRIFPLLKNASVIEYETLRDHPLWVENRKGWGHRQTC